MPRILIVEVDDRVRTFLWHALEDRGYEVQVTGSFHEAARALEERWPDLLIADAVLPDGAGGDLACRASQLGIPAVLITGNPDRMKIMQDQGTKFLPKPFSIAGLMAEVDAALSAVAGRPSRGGE